MMGSVGELADLFARLSSLDLGELRALAAARATADPVRDRAWNRIREVVGREHLERDLDRVRDEVTRWATHLVAITGQEAGSGMTELDLSHARRQAAPAVLDAAAALLLDDRLSEAERQALAGPWRDVIGRL